MSFYKNPYYDPSKAHHTKTGFRNVHPIQITKTALQRWKRERHRDGRPFPPKGGYEKFIQEWCQQADFSISGDAVWWLGHASALFRIDNLCIITDPMFSTRTSPIGFIGPKRKTPNPTSIEALPHIDIVLISHNHYDHLDTHTISQLIQRSSDTLFLVPLGLKNWFQELGAKNVAELDWWDSVTVRHVTLSCVPAQHWSRRGLRDTNRTLWGGWVISHKECNYYFAGDTAYSEYLAEIGQKFAITLALLPIGAYEPRWFMRNMHIDPSEAVQLHRELKCRRSIGIHWATFELTDESLDDPPKLLAKARLEQGVDAQAFIAIPVGAYLILDGC